MLNDIEIAQMAKMKPISDIASSLGIMEDDLIPYGKFKAKISLHVLERLENKDDGKLILVTAINPTPAGEGKTTTTIGLGQAMNKIGKKSIVTLREPSLGPVMGIKGGAAGGGYSQVVPMEDINLHFTGDMHAITAANNLLGALIDNHIHHGNQLQIDQVIWKRAMDMNDRALRKTVIGLGGKINGKPREDGFIITVASEVMAILCLSNGLEDLKKRLGQIIIGYNFDNQPVFAHQLKAEGAMALLMKDAILPNLVQTLENTPCLMHGGPFANIAHGCNSIAATKLALKLSDYTITEAGFGADLGAEKFFDIKCRLGGLNPDCAVIVATARALKYNGGVAKPDLSLPNLDALKAGIVNLERHVKNIKKYGVTPVVAINQMHTDSEDELNYILEYCKNLDVSCVLSNVFSKGGEGGIELANAIVNSIENSPSDFKPIYELESSIKEKISTLVTEIYGGRTVSYAPLAQKAIARIEQMGLSNLPICVAKTQYSFSDNPALLGAPYGFEVTIRDIGISNGAGFIVVYTGDILTMPGLPKLPSANNMDVNIQGKITGLF